MLKNARGGYKLLDLSGYDLSSEVVVPGIYDAIEGSHKALLLHTGEGPEIWLNFELHGTTFVGAGSGVQVSVESDDGVTVTSGTGIYQHNIIITSSTIKVRTIIVSRDPAAINTAAKLKTYIGTDGVLMATGAVIASSAANPAVQINNGGTGGATQIGYVPASGSVTYSAIGSATVQDTVTNV